MTTEGAPPPTTLERLRIFHAIAASGSIAAAARRLGYTPSAVSQQLGSLEREAGVSLVERSNRGVALTAAGERLAERAPDVLDRTQNIFEEVREAGPAVPLVVAAFPTAVVGLLVPLLDGGAVRVVDAEAEEALELLRQRRVDAALTDGLADAAPPSRRGELYRLLVRVEPIRVVAAAAARFTDLASMAECEWVLGSADSRLGSAARDACRRAGFEPRVIVESVDHHIAFDVVSARGAATMLPQLALASMPSGVAVVPEVGPLFERRIELVSRYPVEHNPRLASFAQHVQRASEQRP